MNRSISEHSIEQLFERMLAVYGARFLDLWRDAPNMQAVKDTWREALAGISDESLRRGKAALFHEKLPPTLPRFIELCRGQFAYTPPAITGPRVITPAAREALDAIEKALAPVRAKMIISRCDCNDNEPAPERVPSPHIYREPGEDDE